MTAIGSQESGLIMREFVTAFSKLAPTQREALLLAVVAAGAGLSRYSAASSRLITRLSFQWVSMLRRK